MVKNVKNGKKTGSRAEVSGSKLQPRGRGGARVSGRRGCSGEGRMNTSFFVRRGSRGLSRSKGGNWWKSLFFFEAEKSTESVRFPCPIENREGQKYSFTS